MQKAPKIITHIKAGVLCAGSLAVMILLSGCETPVPGTHVLNVPPTESTRSFNTLVVGKVEVGPTDDRLSTNAAVVLRQAICAEIQKKKIYQSVSLEGKTATSALEIQPRIVQFHRGSQSARYFAGAFAGESAKAHLDVECKFVNMETGKTVALGMFSGEIASGLFGGSPNEVTLSKYVAQHVASFLLKGR